jgi:amino acid adenylation domain-containing protein
MTDLPFAPATARTAVGRVLAAAATAPEASAVVAADGVLTYGELQRRATHLASAVTAAGIGPDDLVAVCLPRSAGFLVGVLGVALAGAGAVGLEPDQPDERIRYMLADSGAALTVTLPDIAARLGLTRWLAPTVESDAAPFTGDEHAAEPAPEHAAYAVYTSGSTGTPKGVVVEHAGLYNLVEWHRRAFGLGPADRCTFLASPGFDAAVWEVWATLAAGASLYVPPDELKKNPPGLRDWLTEHRITVSFAPTPLAESLIALRWPADNALRYLLTGGDVLRRNPIPGLGFTVVNNSGVSEASVVSTSGVVGLDGVPGIGLPIEGVTVRVVDDEGRPVPPGTVGELMICGISVARGYLGRPELTARRFGVDPLDATQRAYRTGDRVRVTAAGEVEFAGRLDDQIQIRGLRVEVGEVAAQLATQPGVAESVVLPLGDGDDRYLAAFVVPAEGYDPAAITATLAARLPEYMLPRGVLELDRFPVTTTGKIDRRVLADRWAAQAEAVPPDLLAPRNDVEATLAAVVAERLKLPAIGVDQNFFLLGGHSMLGAQLIVQIVELYGVEMTLLTLFDNPTIAQLAAEVERLLIAEIAAMSDESVIEATTRLATDRERGAE